MCRCKKIGNLAKSGIGQNREFDKIGNFAKWGGAHSHPNGVLDNYSCGAKKNCLQHAIYCSLNVQM